MDGSPRIRYLSTCMDRPGNSRSSRLEGGILLSIDERPNEAWFEPGEVSPSFPESTTGSAHVKSWNGTMAVVEHDGPCILILRCAYYPG